MDALKLWPIGMIWNDWFCVLTAQVVFMFFFWYCMGFSGNPLARPLPPQSPSSNFTIERMGVNQVKSICKSQFDHHWTCVLEFAQVCNFSRSFLVNKPFSWCWNSNFKWFPAIKNTFSWVQSQSNHRKEVVPPGKSQCLILKYVTFSVLMVTSNIIGIYIYIYYHIYTYIIYIIYIYIYIIYYIYILYIYYIYIYILYIIYYILYIILYMYILSGLQLR